ncbi:MAG: PhzF family phenazine biosynthesis protein, partial [Myxococcales bacterium]
ASRFEPATVPGELLTALGIVPEELDPRLPPRKSTILEGNLYLAVRDRDALARCRPDGAALDELGRKLGAAGCVVYTLDPQPGVDAAMRCFFPGYGILEDPVTGSAAGQLGALLQLVRPAEMPRRLLFTQGDEMGRPGRIEVQVRPEAEPGKVRGWIGGDAVTILRGELQL